MPVFEKHKSKVKMVVLTAHKEPNITWHSIISENDWRTEKIVAGMEKRFENAIKSGKIKATVQVIQFYENGKLFKQIK